MMTNPFRRLHRRALRAQATGESGFAIVLVLGLATVMTLLVGGGLLYATSASQTAASDDVQASIAYNAAIAGVNDYTARMNLQANYCTTTDTSNDALTGWHYMDRTKTSAYRYKVISDCSIATGDSSDVFLEVTGIAGPPVGPISPSVRTITAEIKRPGFRDYVFFTDKEEGDPALPEYGLTTAQQTACKVYSWKVGSPSTTDTRPSNCVDLGFGTGDVLNGKVHTNDMIRINGNATFTAKVTEGCPGRLTTDPCYTKKYIADGGTPDFQAGAPQASVSLAFPATDASVEAAATAGGCVYRGPTRIVLLSSGRMSIASPKTTATTACPLGNNVAMPGNGVLFVDSIASGEPGYQTTCTAPWVTGAASGTLNSGGTSYPLPNDWDVEKNYLNCNEGNVWIEGTLNGIAVVGANNDLFITGDIKYAGGTTGSGADDGLGLVAQNNLAFYHPIGDSDYCRRQYTSTASGKTLETSQSHCTGTLRKKNDALATTDTTPRDCTSRNTSITSSSFCNYGQWTSTTGELCADPCMHNLTVEAALLSISHSVRVPYFNQSYTDDLGTLTINGSVAQYYRGPVRQGSSGSYRGYTKSYNYDSRLVNITLPGFPQPTSTYGSSNFKEKRPAVGSPCFGKYRTKSTTGATC